MTQDEQHVLQKHLADFLQKDVFNSITAEDVLTIDQTGKWWYRGKQLPQERVEQLRDSADKLLESPIWTFIYNELQAQSQLKASGAKTEADLVASKVMKDIIVTMRTLLLRMKIK